jgi:hypothetical protein
MGRYLNLSEQGERIQEVLEIVPSGDSGQRSRTPRRLREALEPGEIDGLVEAYRAGNSIRDLTFQFRTDRSTILKYLKGMDIRRRYPGLDPDRIKEASELYEAGLTSTEIGRIFNVSPDTILRAARKTGIRVRNRA